MAKSKGGASTPRLCPSHWNEYRRQYKAYKVSSKQAEALYEEACKLVDSVQWTCPLPVALGRAERALGATKRCIAALDKEIGERDAHHRRFFTQWTPTAVTFNATA
ncbi:hypothetical protein TRAPUB_4169 [Trametes pubescens]|uniref:Uncharacterized protein n=1 Tax=Trametes pubescens TaxID=154538 RepID=A0A1M2VC04_TRAPU|nr:hypothetical protein TRAPUB_4169 [Trametes pubescens]